MEENNLIRLLRLGRKRKSGPASGCPDETDLAAFAENALAGTDRERLEEHLSRCRHCVGHLAFLVRTGEIETEGEVPAHLSSDAFNLLKEDRRLHSIFRRRWAALSALAASLLVAAGISLWHTSSPQKDFSEFRGEDTGVVLPKVTFPLEGSEVSEDPLEIRWVGVSDSLYYTVRLVDADGDLVWEGQTQDCRAEVPSHVKLATKTSFFLWVYAYLPQGKRVKSPVIGFQISSGD